MTDSLLAQGLLNQNDSLERENEKLKIIISKLMARVESATSDRAQGFLHFERAISLETEVKSRTRRLNEAMDILHATNIKLAQAQSAAETAHRNLEAAVETIPEGFAVFDRADQLVIRNSRFAGIFHDVAAQIQIGIRFEDYLRLCAQSSVMKLPKGDDVKSWVARRLEIHKKKSVNFALELKDKLWLQISEQRTPDGGTIILQTDITDHVRLEREEREKIFDRQSKIIKDTLEHIEQGTLIFDPQKRLIEWNSAAINMLHLPRRLMKSGTRLQRFVEVFEPGRVFTQASAPERIFTWAQKEHPKDILRGEIQTLDDRVYGVLGREMSEGSVVISFNDITQLSRAYEKLHANNATLEQRVKERTKELKEARDSAQTANASKSRFVAAASHDLLQPINAAKLFISSLEHSKLDDKQAHTLDRISQSFQSAESILSALLDISKLDSGKASVNTSSIALKPILQQLSNEFAPLAAQKYLEFSVDQLDGFVYSDPVYLRRILQNLISNAIRYTEKGHVKVRVQKKPDHFKVRVEDTGYGIPREDQKAVFNEFHRVNSNAHNEAGMGLGLTIVERACHMLDHDLELRSTLGEGTQFSLSLRRIIESEPALDTPKDRSAPNGSLENAIVMIVENVSSVREAMEYMLQAWGAAPVSVASKAQAFEHIKELDLIPDVFLVDYHLENDETGLELIEELKSKFGAISSVLLTADHSKDLEKRAKERGVFIRHKPLDIEDLKELLVRLIETGKKH